MFNIAVDLEQSGAYAREILQGVMQFANLHNHWDFLMPPMYAMGSKRPFWHHADGIVTMAHTAGAIRSLRRSKIPLVNTARTLAAGQLAKLQIPTVLPDDAAVARMAFEYLYERHFRTFGFCGHPEASWSLVRGQAFANECHLRNLPCSTSTDANGVSRDWILSLQRPCAILAANDYYGWLAIDACRTNGVSVPEDIAVLGVDNDELLGNMIRPTLSSINVDAVRIGFESAKMLDQLIQGNTPQTLLVEIPPIGVVTRHSTDVLSISDPAVADAERFIREHASEPISVDDVLKEVALSRRNLERRFKKVMNRSLLDEIIRMRIDRALTPAHASPPAAATSPLLPVAVRVGLSIGALPLIPPGGITFNNTLAPLIVGVPVATSVPVPGTLSVIADGLNAFTAIA
jgi:LacI family transcriptional regulator